VLAFFSLLVPHQTLLFRGMYLEHGKTIKKGCSEFCFQMAIVFGKFGKNLICHPRGNNPLGHNRIDQACGNAARRFGSRFIQQPNRFAPLVQFHGHGAAGNPSSYNYVVNFQVNNLTCRRNNMLPSKIGKFIYSILFLCASAECEAQYTKGGFFGTLQIHANFCQIDGDGASGYNKFGFSAGYMVGQGLGDAKNGAWAYITGAAFSIRGSRRPFDPENPGMQSFHFVYQMIDIPVMLARYYNKFTFGAGLRTTYLVKAEDKDGFVPNLRLKCG
jgi:hypothetical protein